MGILDFVNTTATLLFITFLYVLVGTFTKLQEMEGLRNSGALCSADVQRLWHDTCSSNIMLLLTARG